MKTGNNKTGLDYQFVYLIDNLLNEKKDYISYEEIYWAYDQQNPDLISETDRKKYNDDILKIKYQDSARKAKCILGKLLKERGLDFQTRKQGRKCIFKYPPNMDVDLLDKYGKEIKQFRLKTLYELISNSKGILPPYLLSKFQFQVESEMESDNNSNKIIEFDSNPQLKNFELLSSLYHVIKDRKVIKIEYEPYGKSKTSKIIHPHYLKEYNSRWFLFGKEYGGTDCNLALDRITSDIQILSDVTYQSATIDYSTYFDQIVGVTLIKHRGISHIIIKTNDLYTHQRIVTKPIHKSQRELAPFAKQNDGVSYGKICIDVIPNFELLGLLMTFESHIEIEAPMSYRTFFLEEIRKMETIYKKSSRFNEY